jgi:hypothetical protein
MELKNILIGTVVVSMIILGLTSYLNGLKESYNQNIDLSGFNKTESRLQYIANESNKTYSDLTSFDDWTPNTGVIGFLYASVDMLKGGWSALTMPFHVISLFMTMIGETTDMITSETFGFTLPHWLWGAIISIILIIFIMMLIEMFMRWKFQT